MDKNSGTHTDFFMKGSICRNSSMYNLRAVIVEYYSCVSNSAIDGSSVVSTKVRKGVGAVGGSLSLIAHTHGLTYLPRRTR